MRSRWSVRGSRAWTCRWWGEAAVGNALVTNPELLTPGELTLAQLRRLVDTADVQVALAPACRVAVRASACTSWWFR